LPPRDFIIIGKSIGTGSAIQIAANASKIDSKDDAETPDNNQLLALVCMSGFTSIKGIIKDLLGKIAASFVRERFVNEQTIKSVTSPTLLIHGKSD
jgi:hypothetical protein